MPLQLIFTSASQGLTPGRSGYCTVARHRAIPERLAQLLESVGTPHERPEGETFTLRLLEAGDKNWCVLSRFVARGLDYTQRDNRLAHHLIFSLEEAAILPPPAAIAGRWKGWRDEWSGAPTWLEGEDRPLQLETQTPLTPAVTWREETGTGAKAAWLINASGPAAVGLLNPPETLRLLRLLAEASALLGKSAWAATFTTDATTTGSDGFLWAVNSTSAAATIDFTTAKSLPAPSGDIARQAAAGLTSPKVGIGQPQRRSGAAPSASSGNNAAAWIIGGLIILAAGAVAKFVEASGATLRESVQIRIRLLAFTSPHLRDDQSKYLNGEIRRTPQATWIESTPEPGKLPAIGIGLSSRRNEVSLNFPTGEGARAGANRLIEVILPKGDRQCFSLIGDLKTLQPLNLGPDALLLDAETGVIRPAPWAESAVNAFIWTKGSIGLYPEGHEFPDRDLPSIRATRSVLETDIIRLESKQGPGTPPYEIVAQRRKLFKEGKLMEAGAPWSIQAIDANGAAGPRLLEFR